MIEIDCPEGATPLDPDEMEGLMHKHVTTLGQLNQLEQGNIQSGLQWLGSIRNKDILDEQFVRKLHKRLFGDVWKWAGKFRTTNKNIGVDWENISVELRTLLDDVKYWIENNTYLPKEIAVRFHHRLVKIHPFPNGNGRHARIIADALLTKVMDEPPISWADKEDLQSIEDRRNEYISALKEADNENYDPLFDFAGVNDTT